ncbi:hypothetical protein E4U55_000499, partial [Claviceps digitariae]
LHPPTTLIPYCEIAGTPANSGQSATRMEIEPDVPWAVARSEEPIVLDSTTFFIKKTCPLFLSSPKRRPTAGSPCAEKFVEANRSAVGSSSSRQIYHGSSISGSRIFLVQSTLGEKSMSEYMQGS